MEWMIYRVKQGASVLYVVPSPTYLISMGTRSVKKWGFCEVTFFILRQGQTARANEDFP